MLVHRSRPLAVATAADRHTDRSQRQRLKALGWAAGQGGKPREPPYADKTSLLNHWWLEGYDLAAKTK